MRSPRSLIAAAALAAATTTAATTTGATTTGATTTLAAAEPAAHANVGLPVGQAIGQSLRLPDSVAPFAARARPPARWPAPSPPRPS